ncbi:MAG: hypothetical protein NVSMB14_16350 [Isosphaeraceae bacterium]
MNESSNSKLFEVIQTLRRAEIHFSLCVTREQAITILAAVPGERWEIDVFRDGSVELEVFRSDGDIQTEERLAARIAKYSE